MRAIILAAGQGRRLMPHTKDAPTCLVELADRPLLMHQVEALTSAGVDDIHIVTGHCADKIAALGFRTKRNRCFADTDMVASLMCAAGLMDGSDDVLIADSHIVYEPRLIRELQAYNRPLATVVDRQWRSLWETRFDDPLVAAQTLALASDGTIVDIGRRAESYEEIDGQCVGLTKVAAGHARGLAKFHSSIAEAGVDVDHMDMTGFLQVLIAAGWPLQAALVEGGWLKVDRASDLERYRRLHQQGQLDKHWQAQTAKVPVST